MAQNHVVDDECDEGEILARRRSAGIHGRGRLDVTVLTTMDCNFDCVYCYETRQPDSRMTEATERRLLRWFQRELPTARLTLLHWFGGEPLLDTPLIHRLSKQCTQIVADAGGTLALHVTTNGYLLNGWRRELLSEAGIREFQITVDGPPRTHNLMRPLRGGRPTFDRIVQNINETLSHYPAARITLRVNINQDNVEVVSEVFDYFPPELRPRLRLALEPIFGDNCVSATANLDGQHLSSRMVDLFEEAGALGFEVSASATKLLTGRRTYCYAERERQYVFGPSGARSSNARPAPSAKTIVSESSPRPARSWDIRTAGPPGCSWEIASHPTVRNASTCPLCMGGCRRMQAVDDAAKCTLVPTKFGLHPQTDRNDRKCGERTSTTCNERREVSK